VQEGEEGKEQKGGENCWQSGGGRVVFIPGEGPDVAGGEGSHGAARPDRVIHRNIFNRYSSWGIADI
jgi:hypothetical protein